MNIVTFDLDELQCAIDAKPVVEVLRAVALRPIPGQPEFIAGVIDLRGKIVPVLNLRVRFGKPAKQLVPSHQFIIVTIRTLTVALWVDSIVDIVSIRPGAFERREGLIIGTRSLAGVARTPDGLIMIHDVDGFLTELETDALALLGAAS